MRRGGYGIFIVTIYVFILPLPTIINFYKDRNATEEKLGANIAGRSSEIFDEETSNPLAQDDDVSVSDTAEGVATSTGTIAPPAGRGATLSRLAKIQREKQSLQKEMKEAQSELQVLRTQVAAFNSSSSGILQLGDDHADPQTAEAITEPPPATRPAQIMKQIMDDESLSEEVRGSAKQTLEELVSRQLLESKTLTQVESAERMIEAEERERKVSLAKLAREQTFESQRLSTMRNAQQNFEKSLAGPAAVAARQALVTWLMENRLLHHEKVILDVVGQHAAIGDLKLLSEEDLTEISAQMTRVEAQRFASAVEQELAGDTGLDQ